MVLDRRSYICKDIEGNWTYTFKIDSNGLSKVLTFNLPYIEESLSWRLTSRDGDIVRKEILDKEFKNTYINHLTLDLWSPENPALYNLELWAEDRLISKQTFGIVDVKASQDHIYLNGKPYYIRGYIRGLKAHDHENFSFTTKDEYYKHHIELAKSYGFNYVRWHSTIPDESFLNQADRLGLLCHVEFGFEPIWGKDEKGGNILVGVRFDEEEVKKMVSRLSLHPCVALYCLGNEIHKSGGIQEVRRLLEIIRKIDPSKLIMDNCGWGEYDRDTSDIFCQHIGYYFPFGSHVDMFNVKDVFNLDGSIKGPLECKGTGKFEETINVAHPVLAHEVLHYISWPDVDKLDADFEDVNINLNGFTKPWWVDEIRNLEKIKGIVGERKELVVKASRKFFSLCVKEAIEHIRKSSFLQGFMMLQLADTHHYENPNGLLDCFDKPKFIMPEEFKKINDEIVLLIDLKNRCFIAGNEYNFDLYISNYSMSEALSNGKLHLSINDGSNIIKELSCTEIKLLRRGFYSLGRFSTCLPDMKKPVKLTLHACIETDTGKTVENSWDIWAFPEYKKLSVDEVIQEYNGSDGIRVTTGINDELLEKINAGEKVLCLYNPQNISCDDANLYFPYVNDHFKPVIWDRGHQMGAIIRNSAILGDFPHEEVMDFQMSNLVEGAVKINLDDFPVAIDPVIEGVDRPVRDRIAVIEGNITGFDPKHYMRKFGYLFELAIGKGRLVVCTFNFRDSKIEGGYLLNQLISHLQSSDASDAVAVSLDDLRSFLKLSPENGEIEELPMTKYWQRDDLPVETKLFWEELGVDITKL